LFSILIIAGCERKAQQSVKAASPEPPSIEISTATAGTRMLERTVSLTGSLAPDEKVDLGAEVAGKLAKVYVDFGQDVRAGQVIAELDTRELTIQLERVKASLAQAMARIGLTPEQADVIPESTPAIRQAQAQFEDAKSKFESAETLVKSGDIARERFTEVEKVLRAREAALQAAKDELRTQLAAIQGLRAEVRLSEKRLADATVYAPFNGAVTARLASPGQFLKENTPIVTIVKSSPLRLRADVPESSVGSVRPGTRLTFTTDAVPGKEFHAVVRELNPSLDSRSRSLTAEARMVETDSRLRPGMFVQVLLVAEKAELVVVPKQALYNVAGLSKVFAIRNGAAVEVKVQPYRNLGDWIALDTNQIKPGDQVATSNLGALINGMKVTRKAS
jgi:RND family efflux transporter MFP subunit